MAPIVRYPKSGETFSLTLEGKHLDVQPMTLVKNCGYNTAGWKYTGPIVTGYSVRRFQLVSVDESVSWRALEANLSVYKRKPEGLWIHPFRKAFPDHDGLGRVGIFDASWIDPKGTPSFPCIFSSGELCFVSTLRKFSRNWRWLVFV